MVDAGVYGGRSVGRRNEATGHVPEGDNKMDSRAAKPSHEQAMRQKQIKGVKYLRLVKITNNRPRSPESILSTSPNLRPRRPLHVWRPIPAATEVQLSWSGLRRKLLSGAGTCCSG